MRSVGRLLWVVAPLLVSCGPAEHPGSGSGDANEVQGTASTDSLELSPEEMQRLFQEISTPGSRHELLADLVGTWAQHSTWYPPDGGDPVVFETIVETEWVLGGRFLVQRGLRPVPSAEPFESMSFLGHDNARKVFQSLFFDNRGTGMMYREGRCGDAACKTITFEGDFDDPFGGGARIHQRTVTEWEDEGHYRVTLYETGSDSAERVAIISDFEAREE